MAAFVKFNAFVADIGLKVHNLNTDTFKVLLTLTAPVATNSIKADLAEIAAGNGYSAGGTAMTGTGYTQAAGVASFAGSNVVFTASGGSIANFRYAVLYNATAAAGNLIGFWDSGATQTITVGNTFSVLPASTAAVFTVT